VLRAVGEVWRRAEKVSTVRAAGQASLQFHLPLGPSPPLSCLPTCVKWCSLVLLLPHCRHSGKASFFFHREDHSSTVMIL
jgi:hypothetical protein